MNTAIVVALAGLLAGCGGNTKFSGSTVAVSVTPDGSLSGVTIEQLTVMVGGADSTTFTVPATSGLSAGQAQTIDYAVAAGAGTLDFTVTAMAHGMPVAAGAGSVDVQPKSVASVAIALAAVAPPDMAVEPPDMAMPADLAMAPADMTGVVVYDLLGVDLAHGPIVPSNTTVPYDPNAADLAGVVGIDTTGLQLAIAGGAGNDGGTLAVPPAGVGFVVNGSFAVMTVGTWTVDKEVRVTGSRGLIVIAKSVDVKNVIHAEAVAGAPGPGGAGFLAGAGHGGNGGAGSITFFGGSIPTSGGGGGASFGTVGGPGAAAPAAGGGGGGATYGSALALSGGSGGGQGGRCTGTGGAGGGALQISANDSISVELGGVLSAGGGGAQASICSGAGSGGMILLEARAITVRGVVSANGGNENGDAIVGRGSYGGPGAGATVDNGATGGGAFLFSGNGGGGGAGRVTLRTSGPYAADVLAASAVSPAPTLDTSLP